MKSEHLFDKIVNPETGRQVNVNGSLGRRILSNYSQVMRGGACKKKGTFGFRSVICDTCDEVNFQNPTCTNCDFSNKRKSLRNKLCNNIKSKCRMSRSVTDEKRLQELFPIHRARYDMYECVKK